MRMWAIYILLALGVAGSARATNEREGGSNGGGGDRYVTDFLEVARNVLYPWLRHNGHRLHPPVDAVQFLLSIKPQQIVSKVRVYESCSDMRRGPRDEEREACFDPQTKTIKLSRALYRLGTANPAKLRLVAHELFRNMGIEGDGYELSSQIVIAGRPTSERELAVNLVQQLLDCGMRLYGCASQTTDDGSTDRPVFRQAAAYIREGSEAMQEISASHTSGHAFDAATTIASLRPQIDTCRAAESQLCPGDPSRSELK